LTDLKIVDCQVVAPLNGGDSEFVKDLFDRHIQQFLAVQTLDLICMKERKKENLWLIIDDGNCEKIR
jgi:hypothetical protein